MSFVRKRFSSELWTHRDFVRFWTADSLSWIGTQVTLLAMPLIAAVTLEASAFEVGALVAASQVPLFLFGLVAGAWIERRRRRPILISADVLRALLLLAIPIAALLDWLSMPLLYAVAFTTGLCSVFFDIGFRSYLPALVGRDKLVDANSKLEASAASAQVIGPFLGGLLVAVFTAPFAILIDALSFLASALFLRRIEAEEPAPALPDVQAGVRQEISDGLRFVWNDDVLRALTGCSAVNNFAGYVFLSIYVLYMERDLGLSPTAIGAVFAAGGFGALIGALTAERVAEAFGTGKAIILGQAGFGVTGLLVPLAVLLPRGALPLVVAAEFLQWLTLLVMIINAVSLRQAITPDAFMGRVNATYTFVSRGMIPAGALVGGLLGGIVGLPMTLVIGELGMFLAVGWLLFSPIRHIQRPPAMNALVATSASPEAVT